eukprot:snap_masked-scaffold_6-processed-gene-2.29-mRNA-1 protein AED:1.00 eAED:1.00 QI:0/-1/0/0/-1/1/1/0/61
MKRKDLNVQYISGHWKSSGVGILQHYYKYLTKPKFMSYFTSKDWLYFGRNFIKMFNEFKLR